MTQGIVIALTPQELRALLTIARDENYQFYILALISVCHGLRVSEAIALTRSNFSTAADGTYLSVQRLKGSRATTQRLITTPNPLMNEQAVVTEYINGLKPGELLFRDENGKQFKRFHINYLMRYFGKRTGIPRHKWFPHVAKHTAGTLMRQTGSGIEDIADHLGHKNINNARVYAGNTDQMVHVAATKAFAFAAGQGMSSDVSLDQIRTSFARTKQQLLVFLEAPPPPPPAASTPSPKVVKVTSNIVSGRLRAPSRIPAKVQVIKEDDAPPPVPTTGGVIGGVPGGIPGGQLGGVIGGIISASSNPAPAPTLTKAAPTVQRIRISQGVIQGLLIFRVEPTYPPLAQQAHIQGVVVMTALIDKGGNVQHLQVISGHPLLAPAAIAAVKQWRYKPFVLNGQPLEVETTVTVNFHLRSQ